MGSSPLWIIWQPRRQGRDDRFVRTPKPWILPAEPLTRARLHESGVTDSMIRTQVHSGLLRRLRQGVYLNASNWPQDAAAQHLLLSRAEWVANPESVLSHESAAVAWGLPTPGFTPWHDAAPSVTFSADGPHRATRGTAIRRTERFGPADLARDPAGYPITSLARTATDLACGRPLPEALVILDGAGRLLVASLAGTPRRRDYSNPRLVQSVRALLCSAAGSRSGLGSAIDLVVPCRESPAESLTAGHLHASGLPTPQFQAPVTTPQGRHYLDFYWPEAQLVGECDGAIKYAEPSAYVWEKEREQALRDRGYRIVRWLAKEIMTQPAVVMDRIARALG